VGQRQADPPPPPPQQPRCDLDITAALRFGEANTIRLEAPENDPRFVRDVRAVRLELYVED
jgi:hypothetical protein